METQLINYNVCLSELNAINGLEIDYSMSNDRYVSWNGIKGIYLIRKLKLINNIYIEVHYRIHALDLYKKLFSYGYEPCITTLFDNKTRRYVVLESLKGKLKRKTIEDKLIETKREAIRLFEQDKFLRMFSGYVTNAFLRKWGL